MTRWILNVALLSGKELRSVMKDVTLMALILFAFTVAIQLVANGVRAEVMNASVAIMDEDHSELSRRLRDAIQQPYFKPPEDIERSAILCDHTTWTTSRRMWRFNFVSLRLS